MAKGVGMWKYSLPLIASCLKFSKAAKYSFVVYTEKGPGTQLVLLMAKVFHE